MARARRAVAISLAIAAAAAGCGGDDGGPVDPQILAIAVTPDPVILPVEDAAMQLTVTAQTTGGTRDITADPATSYSSGNTSVAGVVAGGEVIANGIGETAIVVRSGGVSDTVEVSVDTLAVLAVSAVEITPESVTLTALGQMRATTTSVAWENGAELRSQSGPPIAYASSNDTIAAVSAAGIITAQAAGSAVIVASFGGRSDSVQVLVDAVPLVSFSQRILPRFLAGQSRCIDAQCHPGTGSAQRNLHMNSYANIMLGDSQNGPVVVPGDGDGSLLVRVLRGDVAVPATPRMPQNFTKFSSAFIDSVALWIDQGAADN